MLNYDPVANLRHYPGIPMSRYGLNPYGENLFRIVFAPSRRTLVCGTFSDQSTGAKWLPEYGHLGDKWVMEKWLSALEIEPGGKQKWDRDSSVNGPWPERGDYFHCHTFESCDPVQANVDKLVMWILEGSRRSFQEVRNGCAAAYEQETKDIGTMQDAAFRDLLPAYGTAPMVGYGGHRGSKSDRIKVAAPLPQKTGMYAGQVGA